MLYSGGIPESIFRVNFEQNSRQQKEIMKNIQLAKNKLLSHHFFFLNMLSAIYTCCIIQVHFKLDFFMEANVMNTDQTAPKEQYNPGPYWLHYRLPEKISRRQGQRTKVVFGQLWVNFTSPITEFLKIEYSS